MGPLMAEPTNGARTIVMFIISHQVNLNGPVVKCVMIAEPGPSPTKDCAMVMYTSPNQEDLEFL